MRSAFLLVVLTAVLHGSDAAACLRGVPDQALAGKPAGQLRLIRECGRIE